MAGSIIEKSSAKGFKVRGRVSFEWFAISNEIIQFWIEPHHSPLHGAHMSAKKLIIPGGSGFLGRTLAKWFEPQGYDVVILSRSSQEIPATRVLVWDAKTLGPWAAELEDADVVVNMAGRSVNCRCNKKNRALMLSSRIDSTLVLGRAIAACQSPPRVWMNSSTATIYRHRYDAPNDEATGIYGPEKEAKDAFSLEVANSWEEAFRQAYRENDLGRTRGILLRSAMIFGAEPGGAYEALRNLVKLRLGGKMGHGRQYVSWQHEDDFCRAIEFLMERKDAEGIYNLCAPNPLTNRDMMAVMRKQFGVRVGLPAFKWMLEIGAFFMRTETELIVKSRRVVPARLLHEGFSFEHQHLETALAEIEKRRRRMTDDE
jgi:uncharacterized protein (TIGR01777 family)